MCVLVSGFLEQATIELLIDSFDPEWRSELETFIVDEYKDALDGIVDLRNTVAHGGYAGGVTLSRVDGYYARIKTIIDRVADLLTPRNLL